ncbi:hypothetical protein NFI96_030420, partial [Prochilodus magdalenae]
IYRLAAVCLGMLCVLLLTTITVLWVQFTAERDQLETSYINLAIERDQLQTSNKNLAKERDQLQTSYTILAIERDQLQTSNKNLAKERDQLQTSYTNLATERDQLQTSYTNLTIERDQLQTSYTNLTIERDKLQTSYNNLTIERDQLQTITDKLHQPGYRDQLQTSYTNLAIERDQLQTSYTNLAIERDQLQTSYTNLAIERDQLQTSYTNLTIERDQLQTSYTTVRDKLQSQTSECRQKVSNLGEPLISRSKMVDCFWMKELQEGWMFFENNIYHVSTEKKNWSDSRQYCTQRGADLVIINSTEEQNFTEHLRRGQRAWIGLTDSVTEDLWRWVDDSALNTTFWRSGEPNSRVGDEDCAVAGEGSDPVKNWADYRCSDRFVGVCEKSVQN